MIGERLTIHEAKACPFCGTRPYIQPWHGGAVTKVMIWCQSARCAVSPQTVGETRREGLRRWNKRK